MSSPCGQCAVQLPQPMQAAGCFSSGKAFRRSSRQTAISRFPKAAASSRYSLYADKSAGISNPCGQLSQQYRQPVQGTAIFWRSRRLILARPAGSSLLKPGSRFAVRRFSSVCRMSDIPLSTTATPGRRITNRNAQAAGESSALGRYGRHSLGRLASIPPCTGSITMMGIPRSLKISYCCFAVPWYQS